MINDLRASRRAGVDKIIFREFIVSCVMVKGKIDLVCHLLIIAELSGRGDVHADIIFGNKIRRDVFDMKIAFAVRHENEGGGDPVATSGICLFAE